MKSRASCLEEIEPRIALTTLVPLEPAGIVTSTAEIRQQATESLTELGSSVALRLRVEQIDQGSHLHAAELTFSRIDGYPLGEHEIEVTDLDSGRRFTEVGNRLQIPFLGRDSLRLSVVWQSATPRTEIQIEFAREDTPSPTLPHRTMSVAHMTNVNAMNGGHLRRAHERMLPMQTRGHAQTATFDRLRGNLQRNELRNSNTTTSTHQQQRALQLLDKQVSRDAFSASVPPSLAIDESEVKNDFDAESPPEGAATDDSRRKAALIDEYWYEEVALAGGGDAASFGTLPTPDVTKMRAIDSAILGCSELTNQNCGESQYLHGDTRGSTGWYDGFDAFDGVSTVESVMARREVTAAIAFACAVTARILLPTESRVHYPSLDHTSLDVQGRRGEAMEQRGHGRQHGMSRVAVGWKRRLIIRLRVV